MNCSRCNNFFLNCELIIMDIDDFRLDICMDCYPEFIESLKDMQLYCHINKNLHNWQ